MMNLETIFKNHFDTPKISDNKLKKFAEDHLQRIVVNNESGAFNDIITLTGNAYVGYFGAISNEDVNTAIRIGLTRSVDNKIAEFKELVSRQEGLIRSTFGKETPEYLEFFPHGLSEYSRVTKENAELLMARITTAARNHAAKLSVSLNDAFLQVQDAYKALRENQLGRKGSVSGNKETAAENRLALELQLIRNLHFIGYTYPGDVAHCMVFFDQSFIHDAGDSSGDADPSRQPSGS